MSFVTYCNSIWFKELVSAVVRWR